MKVRLPKSLQNLNLLTRGEPLADPLFNRNTFALFLKPLKISRRTQRNEQLEAYQNWVAACVNRISTDIKQNKWKVGRMTGPDEEDFEPFEMDQIPPLLLRPNSMLPFSRMMDLTSRHLNTTGESFWYMVTSGPGPDSEVVGLQMLYPHWVDAPIFSATENRFMAWRVTVPGQAPVEIPFSDIIWIYRPHPLQPWRGASPVEQAALSHDMDLYSKAYTSQLLEEGGVPPAMLSVTDSLVTREQAENIRARWKEVRARNAADLPVVGKGAQFQRTGLTMQDLAFLELARMNRDQVLGIYSMPASKLGLVEDANRSNSEVTDKAYSRDVLLPELRMVEEAINIWLMPRINAPQGAVFRFDNPVMPDKEFKQSRANDALERGAITIDEYRKETGRDEIEDGSGNIYTVPIRVSLKETLEESDPPPALQPGSNQPPNNNGGNDDAERIQFINISVPGSEKAKQLGREQPGSTTPESQEHATSGRASQSGAGAVIDDLQLDGADDDGIIHALRESGFIPDDIPMSERRISNATDRFLLQQGDLEREFKRLLRELFVREKNAVTKRIRSLKNPPQIASRALHGIKQDPWDIEDAGLDDGTITMFKTLLESPEDGTRKGLLTRDLLDNIWARQTRSWINTYRNTIMKGLERGWELLKEDTGRDLLDFETVRDRLEANAEKIAERKVSAIRETTRRRVSSTVAAAIGASATVASIAEQVARLYDTFRGARTSTIARTETAEAVNRGKAEHVTQVRRRLDLEVTQTWSAILDDRVREAHAVAHGQTQPVGTPFNVGGEELRFPHDPNGSAGNTINCRCTLVSEIRRRRRN